MERILSERSEEEESNKPENRRYYQQTLPSWYPLLTPCRAAGGYLLIGLLFVLLGVFLWIDASDVVELRCATRITCGISLTPN